MGQYIERSKVDKRWMICQISQPVTVTAVIGMWLSTLFPFLMDDDVSVDDNMTVYEVST